MKVCLFHECFDVVWHRHHKKKDHGTATHPSSVHIHPDEELEYVRGLVGLENGCFAIRYITHKLRLYLNGI